MENWRPFNKDIKFEDIIEEIGSHGKFQIRMNVIFNCLALFFQAMSSYATMIALTVPDHWCHVPGRENTTMSLRMWKNLTIPRYNGAYSQCLMYENPEDVNKTIPCIYGWEYDKTWFTETVATQENWVCDRGMYPNTVFSISHIVSTVCGALLFYSGDRFGRRKLFLLSIGLFAVSRSLLTVSSSVLPLYIVLACASEAAGLPNTEAALATGIELTGVRQRSYITLLAFLSCCLGTITLGVSAWLLGSWIPILLVSAAPCFIPIILNRYLPESPRWLISKGRTEEALEVLKRVATTNGRPLPPDTWQKLNILSERRTRNMGIKSIVTSMNLLKNTAILVFSRSSCSLVIYTLIFNNKSFGENPFVSYICQGLLKLPAGAAAHYVGQRYGRRVSHCVALATAFALCTLLVPLNSGLSILH